MSGSAIRLDVIDTAQNPAYIQVCYTDHDSVGIIYVHVTLEC